jgi:hypothetical protein
MTQSEQIEDVLCDKLLAALHPTIPAIASAIGELQAGGLTPAEAADRLRDGRNP